MPRVHVGLQSKVTCLSFILKQQQLHFVPSLGLSLLILGLGLLF